MQSILESVDLQCAAAVDGFAECSASSAVTASELVLDLCYQPPEDTPTGWELGVGALKIDPDGYVYNADLGISTKVPDATVTCEVYDEDYQAWSEWPAAFYEAATQPADHRQRRLLRLLRPARAVPGDCQRPRLRRAHQPGYPGGG